MAIEIERKFRVLTDPEEWPDVIFTPLAAWEISQAYVTQPGADPEVRVRKSRRLNIDPAPVGSRALVDDAGAQTILSWIAIKTQIPTATTGALSRHEIEPPIEESHFDEIWRLCEGRRLRKLRVEYMAALPAGHRVIMVDTFKGDLDGLVVAEIEFGDWASSVAFEPPGFLGIEVTHDKRYQNASLAAAGKPPRA